MDPEIRSPKAGICSKCGMALEPILGTEVVEGDELDRSANSELTHFTRRFWYTLPLSLTLMFLGNFGKNIFPHAMRQLSFLELVLCLPVIIWAGSQFFIRGWNSVLTRNPNMWTLISIGTGLAFVYSVVATLTPSAFPHSYRVRGNIPTYFEAASTIISLTLLGQILEIRARVRTTSAIRSLLTLAPKVAHRVSQNGVDEDVAISLLQIGDLIRIKPGEAIAADGVIEDGLSSINESMITGESMPITKRVGERVIGSTLNGEGVLLVRVEHVGADTVLAQIVQLVAQAQQSKARMQRMADRVAKYFVLIVLAVALVTLLAWGIYGPKPSWEYGLLNGVAVLIIACPCALGLATPMSIMVASGRAATSGVIFRGADALENLEKIDLLIVDKTGTLTDGRPSITSMTSFGEYSNEELLQFAASLEVGSEHPLANAILLAANGVDLLPVTNFQAEIGLGVRGMVEGINLYLGNEELMSRIGVDLTPVRTFSDNNVANGATLMFLAKESQLIGAIALSDQIKDTSAEAISLLSRSGLKVILASGDNQSASESIGDKLGLDQIFGNQRPDDKLQLIKHYQSQGLRVAMVGDGINDAPALTQADVGIAMGTGTDIAMNSSDVTLVKGDLLGIVRARRISQSTVRNMRENLFFAFAYNSLGIPIAAGALYAATGNLLSPDIAALSMSLSSVSVVFNSLRLRRG